MKIEHLAIWVQNLEAMRIFYETYFGATSNEKYHNPTKNFSSYFLTFSEGSRLEIMHKPEIPLDNSSNQQEYIGLTHFALSLGSKEAVDQLTERLRTDGFKIASEARTTGDGYYESVILDPENNRIELTT